MSLAICVICVVVSVLLALIGMACLGGAMVALARSNDLAEQAALDRARVEELHLATKDILAEIDLSVRMGTRDD